MFRPREPQLTRPAQLPFRLPAAKGQYVANRLRRFAVRVKSRQQIFGTHLEAARKSFNESESIGRAKIVFTIFARDEADILPNRNAIDTPIAAQRPARHGLAGIPLALPVMEKPTGSQPFAETLNERQAASSLHRSAGIDVPLRALRVVDADVRWLATHRQAHILRFQFFVDAMRDFSDPQPVLVGKRPGWPSWIIQTANRN